MGYLDFLDLRRDAAGFANVSAWWIWGQGVKIDSKTTAWAWGHSLSDGYLESLRAEPAAGRLFLPEDHRSGAARAVVLGHRFWRRHYDLAPEAIGKTLEIGGQSYTIVGVTGERFIGTGIPADLYIPMQYTRDAAPEWDGANRNPPMIWGGRVWAMARLANGVGRREAQDRLRSIALDLDSQRPLAGRERQLEFGDYRDPNSERQMQGGLRLLAGAGLLLVLANVNVASLLVARYLNRRREVSILASLGASPGRIARLLVAEGLVLSLLGGVVGIAFSRMLASILRRIILTANPVDIGRWSDGAEYSIMPLDWRVVAFAFAASLVTTLLFGLLPALNAARADLHGGLRAMTAGSGRATGRAQYALVGAQVALAVLLSAAAGLLLRSVYNLGRVDPGFETQRIAIATLGAAHDGRGEPDLRAAFEDLRERATAIPAVEDATLSDPVPYWGWRSGPIASPLDGEKIDVVLQVVGARYFEALRQPILRGRGIDSSDHQDGPLVAVVNQELARIFWPLTDPVGQNLPLAIPRLDIDGEARIVGVVANALQEPRRPARPQIYLSSGQVVRPRMSVLLRTAVEPATLLAAIERELSRASAQVAIVNVATFDRHFRNSLFEERTSAAIGGITGALGLLLAAAGTWSVLTYVVRARRRESAVRMALGATPRDILVRTLREVCRPIALGAAAGIVLAIAGTRLLRAQLFGVGSLDPLTLATAALVVTLCGMLAGFGPSLRASRISPMTVLRED
jgi:predicted permease